MAKHAVQIVSTTIKRLLVLAFTDAAGAFQYLQVPLPYPLSNLKKFTAARIMILL